MSLPAAAKRSTAPGASTDAGPRPGQRLLFIGGLHRSGTTPLARWLGAHPGVSDFSGTDAFEDEGQHLQDVMTIAAAHGGPGRFAFDPDAGLDERSPLLAQSAARQLWRAWSPHWDLDRPVLLEKSPPNLLRMRFLQAAFPGAIFAAVVRHPIAVSCATAKWRSRWRRESFLSLLRHWELAHRRFLEDAVGLERVLLVRYEDLVAAPIDELNRLHRTCGLAPASARPAVKTGLNERYVERWRKLGSRPHRGPYTRYLERRFEPAARAFGYSFREPLETTEPSDQLARSLLESGR